MDNKKLYLERVRSIGFKDLTTEEESRRFVPSTSSWYALEFTKDQLQSLELSMMHVVSDEFCGTVKVIHSGDTVFCSDKLSINELLTLLPGSGYKLAPVAFIGYLDNTHRRKYLTTPTEGYWDDKGNPILLHKLKGKDFE